MEYEIKLGNRTRTLNINIVPFKVHELMAGIETKTTILKDLADDEMIIMQRINELRRNKDQGWFKEVRDLKKEIKEIILEAKRIVDETLFAVRFQAIKMILEKNGISEDDVLMDRKTWEEELDFSVPSDFINECLSKGSKKK